MSEIGEAIDILKNLRDSFPHSPSGDHAAVILGAAIIHLQDVLAGKPYYAETTFQHPTCTFVHRPKP